MSVGVLSGHFDYHYSNFYLLTIYVLVMRTIQPGNGCSYIICNFLSWLIFILPLFLGMVMNAKEFENKEI